MSKKHQKMLFDTLCDKYPKAFTTATDAIKPLAINIREQLIEAMPDCDPKLINRTLGNYTLKLSYQRALLTLDHRVDLSGQPVERVSEEAKQTAKVRLERAKLVQAEQQKKKQVKAKPVSLETKLVQSYKRPVLVLTKKKNKFASGASINP